MISSVKTERSKSVLKYFMVKTTTQHRASGNSLFAHPVMRVRRALTVNYFTFLPVFV